MTTLGRPLAGSLPSERLSVRSLGFRSSLGDLTSHPIRLSESRVTVTCVGVADTRSGVLLAFRAARGSHRACYGVWPTTVSALGSPWAARSSAGA